MSTKDCPRCEVTKDVAEFMANGREFVECNRCRRMRTESKHRARNGEARPYRALVEDLGEDAEYRARVRRAIKMPIPHAASFLADVGRDARMCPVR
jgi:Zn ribbon nucleic-acid-binding protein